MRSCHRRRQLQYTHSGSVQAPLLDESSQSSHAMSHELQETDHYINDATRLSMRARYLVAVINFVLFSYAVFLGTVVKLLHCVSLPSAGSQISVLFIQGTRVCDYGGWQLVFVAATIALVAVAVTLPLVTVWGMRALGSSGSLLDDTHLALKRALIGPYRPQWYLWECVLLLHRTVLSLVYTFLASQPTLQAVLLVLTCAVALVMTTSARPFLNPLSQSLQVLFLSCLVAVAVLSVVSSCVLQFGAIESPTLDHLLSSLQQTALLIGYVVPVVAFIAAVVVYPVLTRFSRAYEVLRRAA